MGGFLTNTLNIEFKKSLYEIIIDALIKCSGLMKKDCLTNDTKIINHEEKIRTHLLENYLENNNIRSIVGLSGIALRFMPEALETYSKSNDTYVGRADIKVVSSNWLLSNNKDYYIIECKRINGSKGLNEKYIDEGICRFVVFPPKYPSYNNKNIMFGFVVKNINIVQNVSKIAKLHEDKLNEITNKKLTIIANKEDKGYCLCESAYQMKDNTLELQHIFYDFSSIIKNK